MHDFIAIGDIVTDAFIKLKDASVNCDINNENCTITMSFGDKIPYESVHVVPAVGNAPNASVSAARLGLNSALVANIGDDENGKDCLKALKENKVHTDFIDIHQGKETNYHYVLWYDNDRTILVKHHEYERKLPDMKKPQWIYLSSLGGDTIEYQDEIAEFIKKTPDVNLAFQPGTFQMKLGHERLKDIYEYSKIFFCNTEEAARILDKQGLDIKDLLKEMHALGPETVVLTGGPKGAWAYDGSDMLFQPIYPDPKPPYERTGAGDAFSSTVVASLALGNDLPTALSWGAVNSMSVVQEVGAQAGLLTRDKLEEYLEKAPEDFKIKKL